jgi:hypothetical protein
MLARYKGVCSLTPELNAPSPMGEGITGFLPAGLRVCAPPCWVFARQSPPLLIEKRKDAR